MKVLGIGESVIDTTSVVRADKVVAPHSDPGGPVLSALVLLSRLGYECTLMTSLGQDAGGRLIETTLKREGIRLIKHIQPATKHNKIMVDGHTGQREKHRGTTKHSPIQGITKSNLQAYGLIIMDRHEQQAFHEVIAQKQARTYLISDPSTEVSPFTIEMLRHSTCPILPIESLIELAHGASLTQALQNLYAVCNKPLVVTLGHLGSLIYDGKGTQVIAPLTISAVDTNGAGDVYRGAFAYMLTQGKPLVECAHYANTAAALQCTKRGNVHAIPAKDEIDQRYHNLPQQTQGIPRVESYFASISVTHVPVHMAPTPVSVP